MTNTDKQRLCEIFSKSEQLLEQYNDIAAVIMKTESDEIELLAEKIAERQALIDEIEVLRKEGSEILNNGDKLEAELVRSMLTGDRINERIADDLVPVRKAVVNLRSAQTKAAESDRALQLQFESRLEEAKSQLKELNNEKKKLDYYSSLNQSSTHLGGTLDSSF